VHVVCTNWVDPVLTYLAVASRKLMPSSSVSIWFDWLRSQNQAHNPKVAGSNPAPATKQPPRFHGLGGFAFSRVFGHV
jgi:hypothetical protein